MTPLLVNMLSIKREKLSSYLNKKAAYKRPSSYKIHAIKKFNGVFYSELPMNISKNENIFKKSRYKLSAP